MYRRRYNLPPTDPRFLGATREQIVEDYWANFYAENGIRDEVEDDDFDLDQVLEGMEKDDWEPIING